MQSLMAIKNHLFQLAIVVTSIGLTAIGLGSVILCPLFRHFGFNHLHFNDVLNPFGISTEHIDDTLFLKGNLEVLNAF